MKEGVGWLGRPEARLYDWSSGGEAVRRGVVAGSENSPGGIEQDEAVDGHLEDKRYIRSKQLTRLRGLPRPIQILGSPEHPYHLLFPLHPQLISFLVHLSPNSDALMYLLDVAEPTHQRRLCPGLSSCVSLRKGGQIRYNLYCLSHSGPERLGGWMPRRWLRCK